MHNKKTYASLFFMLILSKAIISSTAYASNNAPIPPKRPSILNVSPAYIEELRNRHKPKKSEDRKSSNTTSGDKTAKNHDTKKNTTDRDGKINFLYILDQKPISTIVLAFQVKPSLNSIEPAAGKDAENTATLMSLALNPEQINLDKNTEDFLKNHALKLLRENEKLKIEIYAHATPSKDDKYSNIRLSLARALTVRSFLLDENINPQRLKLNPVAYDDTIENSDRIDLLFITAK